MQTQRSPLALILAATIIGCGGSEGTAGSDDPAAGEQALGPGSARRGAGMVYTTSNDQAGNAVLAFAQAPDGTLTPAGTFPTGGTGTGSGLGSQGALSFSRDGRWLLVVNAGSDDVSIFAVSRGGGLELTGRAPSGGDMPISVTATERLVFVVNAGAPNNVSGLRIGRGGDLQPIPGATQPLSADAAGPAQVELDPKGDFLVVTEKSTNRISLYEVEERGDFRGPRAFASNGETPFGFAFTREKLLVVSEAFGGRAGESAVSSYRADDDRLDSITVSAPDFQAAACWIAITGDGRFAYTTNTGSDNISGYAIDRRGALRLLDDGGVTAATGDAPTDMALSRGSRFLYALDSGDGSISGFRVQRGGGLEAIGRVNGLPRSAVGLTAR